MPLFYTYKFSLYSSYKLYSFTIKCVLQPNCKSRFCLLSSLLQWDWQIASVSKCYNETDKLPQYQSVTVSLRNSLSIKVLQWDWQIASVSKCYSETDKFPQYQSVFDLNFWFSYTSGGLSFWFSYISKIRFLTNL